MIFRIKPAEIELTVLEFSQQRPFANQKLIVANLVNDLINPGFLNQMGVMTIVPVRWYNIIANIWKAMIVRPLKKVMVNMSRMFI